MAQKGWNKVRSEVRLLCANRMQMRVRKDTVSVVVPTYKRQNCEMLVLAPLYFSRGSILRRY